MKDNSIGHWNPAWGPKPEKVKERKPPRKQQRWFRVTCWTCPERPAFSVYGPETLEEKFHCAGCGTSMSVSITADEAAAKRTPQRRRRGRLA